jgi:hypothetical protein
LFRREAGNRTLQFIAVSGGATFSQVFTAGIVANDSVSRRTLQHFERVGLLSRDHRKTGRGAGVGLPRKYRLNPNFMAYTELRSLLFTLVATTYPDIASLVRTAGKSDRSIARHLRQFEAETKQLASW